MVGEWVVHILLECYLVVDVDVTPLRSVGKFWLIMAASPSPKFWIYTCGQFKINNATCEISVDILWMVIIYPTPTNVPCLTEEH